MEDPRDFWRELSLKCDPDEVRFRASLLMIECCEAEMFALLKAYDDPDKTMEKLAPFLPEEPWDMLPLHTLDDLGLIDYGVSVRVGWLTEWGHAVLRFLEKNGCDVQEWSDS